MVAAHAQRPRRRINYVQTGVYLCLVLVVCFVFFMDNRNREQDKVALCRSGMETRNVQRATVEAIYNLATSFAAPPASRPLTDAEIDRINAYIDRVNVFRENMYKQIKPSEICLPYVDDDNVKPPTPPVPPISKENAT